MSGTLQRPQTPAEQSEVDYGENLIWRLIGSTITMFGASADGEILLSTERNGVKIDLIVGKDELGEISLFELNKAVNND